ncbi:MAG: hypothetical protein ABI813_06375 [Bacteroidota bacterium]
MKKARLRCLFAAVLFLPMLIFNACTKGGDAAAPTDPCAGITITVSGIATDAEAGSATGSIAATASGSTGFVFSLNGGTAQASGNFNNLAAGKYIITAKNTNGCSGTTSITINAKDACAGKTAGPLFTAVKVVITSNCAVTGCHNGTQAPNYTMDCSIVDYADLIKQRAVDQAGTATQMPQPPRASLVPADRDKITAWIAAGKRFTD